MNQEIVLTLWDQLQSQMTVQAFYQALQLPFYRWIRKSEKKFGEREKEILAICCRHHQRYGFRKVTAPLKRMGLRINHKKVVHITKTYNPLSKAHREMKVYYGGTEAIVAPNLVACNFEATAPTQKWLQI